MKIDAFAHILTPRFYQRMLRLAPDIPQKFPFIKIKTLISLPARLKNWPEKGMQQVISFANLNPEDFAGPDQAAEIADQANQELDQVVAAHPEYFAAGVGMLPMNNIPAALQMLAQIKHSQNLVGAQIFTRHLGRSIADPKFKPVLLKAAELDLPLWLHPVFDQRKPDNNLVFSWEYELSQAMLQLVESNIFQTAPSLKILVHHTGAMVPFFSGRIDHILSAEQAKMFKCFYVDTAILGNPPALALAIDYYGVDHVLFGTDAPFAVMPSGADRLISKAINQLPLSADDKQNIFAGNFQHLIR